MITTSKDEIIKSLESVSPTRLTVKQLVEQTNLNKQTITRTLKKLSELEKELYGLHSIRCRRETTVKGRVYISIEKRWWKE